MIIPPGKKVIITRTTSDGETRVPRPLSETLSGASSKYVPLVLEEDLQINLDSSFSELYSPDRGGFSKAINLIGQAYGQATGGAGFGTHFKQFGFQAWEGTSPLSFSLNFGFYMGTVGLYSAKHEVYEPVMQLCKLCLPTLGFGGSLVSPGPSPASLFTDEENPNLSFHRFTIKIGQRIYIPSVIFTKVQPVFSNEVDEEGYPIHAKVMIDVRTTETATAEMIDEAFLTPSL